MARLGGDGLGQRSQQDAGIPRGRVSSKDTCELLTKEAAARVELSSWGWA